MCRSGRSGNKEDPVQDKVREAIVEELQRQAKENPDLKVEVKDDALTVQGKVDLDALSFVVVGAVAGGP